MITGVGTGGHITAVSEVLKGAMPGFQDLRRGAGEVAGAQRRHALAAQDPGDRRRLHPRQLPRRRRGRLHPGTEEDAFAYAQRAAKEEGIFVGPSSGASLAAVAQKLPELPPGSRVLAFCYDTGERYLSIEGLFG